MNKISKYFGDSYRELTKEVTWPNWDNLQQTTLIVIASTLVITLVIFAMNAALSFLVKQLYELFK